MMGKTSGLLAPLPFPPSSLLTANRWPRPGWVVFVYFFWRSVRYGKTGRKFHRRNSQPDLFLRID